MTWGLPGGRACRAWSGWPPVAQCGGGGEGGGTPSPWFAPPSSPGRPLKGPLGLRRPGRRRSAVGRQRAGRAGACLVRGAPSPRVQRPLRGGGRAAVSSVCLRPLLGLRGRGGGGELKGPSGPLAPPPFFFYVDQFEQSSGPGHHPMQSTLVGGITYKWGGKVAGHGSCMAVVCRVSPVSLFAFWEVLRMVWVEGLTWIAAKVVWRVVLVVEVLCAAGMIVV